MSRAYGCWSRLSHAERQQCVGPQLSQRDYLQIQSSRKAWRVIGELALEWNHLLVELKARTDEEGFKDEIRKSLAYERQSLPPILFNLYLVARKEDVARLKPTIVAECRDILVAKEACKALQNLKEYTLAPLIGSYEIDYAQKMFRLRADSDSDTFPLKRNLCGAQVLILNLQPGGRTDPKLCTTATIGGVVIVDGKHYAMTAAHAFFRNATDVNSDVSASGSSDASASGGGGSSDESANSALSRAGITLVQSKVYAEKCDRTLIDASGTLALDEEPVSGSLINTNEPNVLINRDEDWALVPVNNPVYELVNRLPLEFGRNRNVTAISDIMPSGKVNVITGVSTLSVATMSSTASLVLSPGSKTSTIVWCAFGRSAPGDCGSWLVTSEGRAVAMVVAGSDDDEIFCLPLSSVFQSIQQSLGIRDMPSLPIVNDTVSQQHEDRHFEVESEIDITEVTKSPETTTLDMETSAPSRVHGKAVPTIQSNEQFSQIGEEPARISTGRRNRSNHVRFTNERGRDPDAEPQYGVHYRPRSRQRPKVQTINSDIYSQEPLDFDTSREHKGRDNIIIRNNLRIPQSDQPSGSRSNPRQQPQIIYVQAPKSGSDQGQSRRRSSNWRRRNRRYSSDSSTNRNSSDDSDSHSSPSLDSDIRHKVARLRELERRERLREAERAQELPLFEHQRQRDRHADSYPYPDHRYQQHPPPYYPAPRWGQAPRPQIANYAEHYPGQVDLNDILNQSRRYGNGRTRVSHRDVHPEILNSVGIQWWTDPYDSYYIQIPDYLPESTMKDLRVRTQHLYDTRARNSQPPIPEHSGRYSGYDTTVGEPDTVHDTRSQDARSMGFKHTLDRDKWQEETNRHSDVSPKDSRGKKHDDVTKFDQDEDANFERSIANLLQDAGVTNGVSESILRLYRAKEERINNHIEHIRSESSGTVKFTEEANAVPKVIDPDTRLPPPRAVHVESKRTAPAAAYRPERYTSRTTVYQRQQDTGRKDSRSYYQDMQQDGRYSPIPISGPQPIRQPSMIGDHQYQPKPYEDSYYPPPDRYIPSPPPFGPDNIYRSNRRRQSYMPSDAPIYPPYQPGPLPAHLYPYSPPKPGNPQGFTTSDWDPNTLRYKGDSSRQDTDLSRRNADLSRREINILRREQDLLQREMETQGGVSHRDYIPTVRPGTDTQPDPYTLASESYYPPPPPTGAPDPSQYPPYDPYYAEPLPRHTTARTSPIDTTPQVVYVNAPRP